MSLIADFSYNIFIFYAFTFSCFVIYGCFSDPPAVLETGFDILA